MNIDRVIAITSYFLEKTTSGGDFAIFGDSWRSLAPELSQKIVYNPLSFVFFLQITLHSHISLNIHPIWLIFGLNKRGKLGPAIPGQE